MNRRQPFGYRMELGAVVPHPVEAETVRWIFTQYLAGASYTALVESLGEQGIPYLPDKPWNKNMVARILEDTRYTGARGYPPLLQEEVLEQARAQRAERAAPPKKTPPQKELRKLCGGAPPDYVERQVLGLLNRLCQDPERIQCPQTEAEVPPAVQAQRQELDTLLRTPPVDEGAVRAMALRLAAEQLDAIGPEEYETLCLQRFFQDRPPMKELDRDLLHEIVKKITCHGGRVPIAIQKLHGRAGNPEPEPEALLGGRQARREAGESSGLLLFSAGRSRWLTLVPTSSRASPSWRGTTAGRGPRSSWKTSKIPSSAASPPKVRQRRPSPRLWAAGRSSPATSAQGRGEGSRTLQMMERPLMTPDELKSLPKGEFVVMKTGTHPSKPEPPLENRNAPSPYNGSKGQGQKEEKA